uniref:Uncharacterized protein n=1 Tax=Serinus canaria TaxID=9135 RepID=A0A8C9KRC0_SERCA
LETPHPQGVNLGGGIGAAKVRDCTKSNFTSFKTKGMLSFYNGIFHWIKIAPFTALVINNVFIASVILLYIWTKVAPL